MNLEQQPRIYSVEELMDPNCFIDEINLLKFYKTKETEYENLAIKYVQTIPRDAKIQLKLLAYEMSLAKKRIRSIRSWAVIDQFLIEPGTVAYLRTDPDQYRGRTIN